MQEKSKLTLVNTEPTGLNDMMGMLAGIYTPTYNSGDRFFDEVIPSVLAQTHTNWEWVIWDDSDNPAFSGRLDKAIDAYRGEGYDITVARGDKHSGKIGYVKSKAVGCLSPNCSLFVELDHDDQLTDDCLEELLRAQIQNPDAGMLFSNCAEVDAAGKSHEYDAWYWEYRDAEFKGETVREGIQPCIYGILPQFPMPTSHYWTLMPNHVRAYVPAVYEAVGGYDETLDFADDYDLFLKMFKSSRVVHINKMLYVYHRGGNTWSGSRNAELQAAMTCVRESHLPELRVDIGSGMNPVHGFMGLEGDLASVNEGREAGHSIVFADVEKDGLPFKSNAVAYINSTDSLGRYKDKVAILEEIYRVLRHGGVATIQVPSTDGRGAFQDPTSVSFWNENSFADMYMNGEYRYGAKYCFMVNNLRTTPLDETGVCWVTVQLQVDKSEQLLAANATDAFSAGLHDQDAGIGVATDHPEGVLSEDDASV